MGQMEIRESLIGEEGKMSEYQSVLPVFGDTVYWADTVSGHGTLSGTVEQCDMSGVLVSMAAGDSVRFLRVRYEAIVKILHSQKGEK
jgi:hypothetical protein